MFPFTQPQFYPQLLSSDDGIKTNSSAFGQHQTQTKLTKLPSSNKDSDWLTLEVCRDYARETCPRDELSCRFAHPPKTVETSNGRVVCCYDFIKGKCHRIKPPCKYLHPPPHLKEQLLQNGKNNLIVKHSSGPLVPLRCNGSRSQSVTPYQTIMPFRSSASTPPNSVNESSMPLGFSNFSPMPYMSHMPYFFIPTQDSVNFLNNYYRYLDSPSSYNLDKSINITNFNIPMQPSLTAMDMMTTSTLMSPMGPVQQCMYNKTYNISCLPMVFRSLSLSSPHSSMPY